ncbi:MAG: hydroxysqualene dehydroxylase HpnE [Planctomycetota bacterium]
MAESGNGDRVVVIGGGVAGIAAAVRLAEEGVAVTLVESRPRLGGRAGSFEDPATGEMIDNCQHVVLRACTGLMDLYRRLKVLKQVQWYHELYFADGKGGVDVMRGDDLPAPLHLVRSLLGFKGMTWGEKWHVMRGVLSVMQVSRRGRWLLEDESFGGWLRSVGQPEHVIKRFWEPIVVSACNAYPDETSASYGLKTMQDGLLYTDQSYEMGLSLLPLVELYDAAIPVIEAAGGEVLRPKVCKSLEIDHGGKRVTAAVLNDGTRLEGPAFVSAVPWDRLAAMTDEAAKETDARLGRLDQLEASPIVGVHLYFKAGPNGDAVMELPHLVIREKTVQWIFNKGMEAEGGSETAGTQHLHAVISAADELMPMSANEIEELVEREVREVLVGDVGRAAGAELVHARVVKEKRATFKPVPGVDRLRPAVAPVGRLCVSNLFLAGDWVSTGWPATMEGAARSGDLAARGVLGLLKQDVSGLPAPASDPRPAMLYRVISG